MTNPRTSLICTMFEKRYALGVGVLLNSLHHAGFAGEVCLGYRGPVPSWIAQCRRDGDSYYLGDMRIQLRAMDQVEEHFTNYKPQFMLRLMDDHPHIERFFYIDPDIVVKSSWSYFDEWASDAVALCADVNAQCPMTHPLRQQWRRFYSPHGFSFSPRLDWYVNAGFIGVPRSCRRLLVDWQRAQELMAPVIGSLKTAFPKDRSFLFHMTDQDALNAMLDASDVPLAVVGQDGMDFIPGGWLLSHAQGRPKPWDKAFIREALGGRAPTQPDKQFWKHAAGPLRQFSSFNLFTTKVSLRVASAIGRCYRRS